ncbi:MAG: T9SS type A sorting domain-containing protein, partial [Bacteroidota bacterium]
ATFTTMETEGYWEVDPDLQPTGGTFTVTEYPSPGWVFSNVSYTQVRQDAVGTQWNWNSSVRVTALKRRDYPSFSNFGIASSNDVLPVEGLMLAGKAENSAVRLDWATTQEINSAFFEVQRSTDGHNFVPIGEVAAGGDLPEGAAYHFYDVTPGIGLNYYRLRQVDRNGLHGFSNTVMVAFGGDLGVVVYPNPARDQVFVQYDGAEVLRMSLTNMLGQVVWQDGGVTGSRTLNVADFPRGMYLLHIRDARGNKYTKKLQFN